MRGLRTAGILGFTGLALVVLLSSSGGLLATPSAGPASDRTHGSPPTTLPQTTFVSAPPSGAKGPDDLALLSVHGLDHGRDLVWTAFQNGVNPNGTAGSPGGPTWSTVVAYDPGTGAIVRSVNVTGKVDGLAADRWTGTILATVNEDDHSAFNVIYPATGAVATYRYSPDPAVNGNGGTDSIAVRAGAIYVAHSNPNDTTQATDYRVTLVPSTLTAQLSPVFSNDATAWNLVTHATVTLALTDPDTNLIMPAQSPRFSGDLATVSQGDGEIIFASHLNHHPQLSVLPLQDNVSGNVPPIDGVAVASCGAGTLYVVDAKGNAIYALDTHGWASGTVFVGEPNDNGNPLVGTLDLSTGVITPLGNHFQSPKGLLFVADPSAGGCGDGEHGNSEWGHDHHEGEVARGDDAHEGD